jgi:histidine ammonia-lyase
VISLGARPLGIDEVRAVAVAGDRVEIAAGVAERLLAARAVVERALAKGEAVYGLTTGLGAAVDTRLAPEAIAAFQRRAVRARAVGVGDLLSTQEVRALLAVRLAGLVQGASGISPDFVPALAAMLNAGVHPLVRRVGSLGEADLAQVAEAMLSLLGEGEAEYRGELLPGGEAMAQAGIALPEFGPKDGLALINSNAFGTGLAVLAAAELRIVLDAAALAGALSLEAFRANLSPFSEEASALRPLPSQIAGAARLRALLAGSALFAPGEARRVQDPLSFRCLAPVLGAALEQCETFAGIVEAELAGAGDSPAVLGEGLASTANFDMTALALAGEGLGLAAAHLAATGAARITKLMSPAASELPRFLTPHGGTHAGFATVQKTAAALEAQIRQLAQPLGAMCLPVADGVEDYAPMTPRVIEKLREIGRLSARLVAIELIVAAQALDFRPAARLGAGAQAAREFVRRHVDRLDEDRSTGREIEALAIRIAAGELAEAAP